MGIIWNCRGMMSHYSFENKEVKGNYPESKRMIVLETNVSKTLDPTKRYFSVSLHIPRIYTTEKIIENIPISLDKSDKVLILVLCSCVFYVWLLEDYAFCERHQETHTHIYICVNVYILKIYIYIYKNVYIHIYKEWRMISIINSNLLTSSPR